MKRAKYFMGAAIALLMVFAACELEDLVNPTITLTGGDMEIVLNDAAGFTEPGFTATDDKDGDLTSQVIVGGDVVDVTKVGSYEITYSVSDNAGNQATVKRTVDVIVNQATYTGGWGVVEVITGSNPDPNWTYNATVTASGVDQTKILIANFGGFSTNFVANVNFDKFGNFTIPNQPLTGSGYDGTLQGTGTTSQNGLTLTINYDVNYTDGDHDICAGTWTKSK